MTDHGVRPDGRWKRRLAWAAALLAALVVALAAGAWFLRDLPRRRVEQALAERLGAEVKVGSLEIQGLDRFVLRDLRVRRMGGQPRLEELRVGRLYAVGEVREILGGNFESLRFEGMTVRLRPPPPPAAAAGAAQPVAFAARRIEIARARILLAGGGDAAELLLDAALTGVWNQLAGEVRFRSERAPLEALWPHLVSPAESGPSEKGSAAPQNGSAPAAAGSWFSPGASGLSQAGPAGSAGGVSGAGSVGGPAGGALEGFEATARIAEGGGSVDLEARARRVVVESAGRSFALATPSMVGRARRSPQDGRWAVTIEPSLALVETASAAFTFDPASGEVADLVASLRGLDAAPLLAAAPLFAVSPLPRGWEVEGKLNLSARGESEKLDYEVAARLTKVAVRLAGARTNGASSIGGAAGSNPGAEREGRESKSGGKLAGPAGGPAKPGVGISGADGDRLESKAVTLAAHGTLRFGGGGSGDGAGGLDRRGVSGGDRGSVSGGDRGRAGGVAGSGSLANASATLEATLDIGDLSGTIGGRPIPASLFPVHASVAGELAGAGPAAFRGGIAIETSSAGRLSLDGSIAGGDGATGDARLDATWAWTGWDARRLLAAANAAGFPLPAGIEADARGSARGTLSGSAAAPLVAGAVELESLAVTATRPAEAVAPDTAGGPDTIVAGKAAAARERVTEKGAEQPGSAAGTGSSAPAGAAAAGDSAAMRVGAAAREPTSAPAGRTAPGESATAPAGVAAFRPVGVPLAWALREGKARAAFRWQAPSGPIALGALDLAGLLSVPPLETLAATLHARGAFDPSSGEVRLDESEIAAAGLARAHLSGTGSVWAARGEADRASFRAVVEQADLSRWRVFLRPLIGDPAPSYSVTGSAGAELTGAVGEDGALRARGKATIEKSGFSSGDGSQVLQGLDTVWDLELTAALDPPSGAISAKAKVGGFQLLWGSLFADGSTLDSQLAIDAAIGAAPSGTSAAEQVKAPAGPGVNAGARDAPWRVGATWTFPDGPRIEGSIASSEPEGMAYAISVEAADLGATVSRYLRGPFGDSVPWFRRIEAGGSLRAKASGVISAPAITMTGRVTLDGVRVEGTEGAAEVEGLDLALPIDLRWGAAPPGGPRPISGGEGAGLLGFRGMRVQGLQLAGARTPLRVRADSVELAEPLAVNIFGGVLALERLRLADALGPARRAETAIALASLDLRAVSRDFGLIPLEGTMDAYFPKVTLTPARLEIDGGGGIDVFGGHVIFGEISGEDILTRFPKVSFSAEFEGIDLGRVTRTYDFGEMTGIVKGYVRDCTLFRGAPVAFEARIETEERKGIRRTVNVKAINNLAILGTGGKISVFDRGIQKFLDKYNYDRLGVQLTLKSDALVLRGLERSGQRELFLKGAFPFPINVINAQPGYPVSFQTMAERLRSLDLGKVSVQR